MMEEGSPKGRGKIGVGGLTNPTRRATRALNEWAAEDVIAVMAGYQAW